MPVFNRVAMVVGVGVAVVLGVVSLRLTIMPFDRDTATITNLEIKYNYRVDPKKLHNATVIDRRETTYYNPTTHVYAHDHYLTFRVDTGDEQEDHVSPGTYDNSPIGSRIQVYKENSGMWSVLEGSNLLSKDYYVYFITNRDKTKTSAITSEQKFRELHIGDTIKVRKNFRFTGWEIE